ncbi:MAG: cell envelope integrity protein CreD [Acidobacteriota bacterium]|nr:cell envelope integrity protein CreD [Acidobacteriota bacterium]
MGKAALLFLKLVVIGGLAVVILIALYLVDNVISDRQSYRDQAVKSISESYASEQRILGPMLVQPYRQRTPVETLNDKGVKHIEIRTTDSTYTIFPAALNVKGTLKPSIRRHGLYRVPVYEFQGMLSGHFDVSAPAVTGDVQFGIPYIAFTVEDARGIVATPVMRLNGVSYPVLGAGSTALEQNNPVHPELVWGTNLRALLPAVAGKSAAFDFALDLTLAGTQKLELVPVGTSNRFELSSPWAEPLFAGQFLPRSREISKDGFHAVWEISSLASATQHQMNVGEKNIDVVNVSLVDPIDPYRLSDRAVKYGILFVLLTFGGFFLFEIVKRMHIHPVQYLLVGFCLAVFFLLLVSFSEHIAFGLAYLIASVSCIGLLTYYLVFVLRSTTYGVAFGAILTTLYAAIYGLLVSEDNALLLGSLLLFGVIALVMIATRKIDWYQRTSDLPPPTAPPPYSVSEVPER